MIKVTLKTDITWLSQNQTGGRNITAKLSQAHTRDYCFNKSQKSNQEDLREEIQADVSGVKQLGVAYKPFLLPG